MNSTTNLLFTGEKCVTVERVSDVKVIDCKDHTNAMLRATCQEAPPLSEENFLSHKSYYDPLRKKPYNSKRPEVETNLLRRTNISHNYSKTKPYRPRFQSPHPYHVDSPRKRNNSYDLVGIEPNPGPVPVLATLAALKVASKVVSAVKQAKKAKNVINTINSVVTRTRKPRSQGLGRSRNSMMSAPTSLGLNFSNRISQKETFNRISFDGLSLQMGLSAASAPLGNNVFFSDGNHSTATAGLDVKPYSLVDRGPGCCGLPISKLAMLYSTYRFVNLQMEFVPLLPTSTPGVIAFGATSNPFDLIPSSLLVVGSSNYNVITSLWRSSSMDLTPIFCGSNARQPWFLTYPHDASPPDTALGCPGSVQAYCTGLPLGLPINTTIGFIRFKGVIEFKGLCDLVNLSASSNYHLHPNSSNGNRTEQKFDDAEEFEDIKYVQRPDTHVSSSSQNTVSLSSNIPSPQFYNNNNVPIQIPNNPHNGVMLSNIR